MSLPDREPPDLPPAKGQPFSWDANDQWAQLQREFEQARARGCELESPAIDEALEALGLRLKRLEAEAVEAEDPSLSTLEQALFAMAPRFGACPSRTPELVQIHRRLRTVVKAQSRRWDLSSNEVRDRLYRLLYGGRAAVEELLLQMPRGAAPSMTPGEDAPSQTPSAVVHGVRVHSGDILLSRGGAPTSALIARGADRPGNFSHVALVHVGEDGTVSAIEAHIESGVVVSTLDEYLGDRKLRVLVLRARADLPQLVFNPMLPHLAATAARTGALQRHIPYDFAMDPSEPGAQFCSEVVSSAYGPLGVQLWEGLTTMSTPGLARWLAAFGVRNFETYGPSDLEYDPKLAVVAEWHDPEALFDDHVDSAVIDVMLEGAERGDGLGYEPLQLPLARLAKAWSMLLNAFGEVGPVPEGMSATTALRARWLADRHGRLRQATLDGAAQFEKSCGYRPPYWELVTIAREALGAAAVERCAKR